MNADRLVWRRLVFAEVDAFYVDVNRAVRRSREALETNAQALAKLGLLLAKRAKDRHPAIQHFMLVNDSATVAVEVPIYLYPHEAEDLQLTGVLTGHIDLVQIRGNRVWILDYKPEARREKRAKYQIYLYARALSVRTGIPLSRFALAYFDDKDYFEVAVIPPTRSRAA